MNSSFILLVFLFFTLPVFGQVSVDISKTKKITQNGIEITAYEGEPLTGFLTENYPNGKLKSWITVKDGIANGLWQEWLENGHLRYNAYWKDGKGHGLWQYFHDNGALKYEEAYIMDIPNGISRTYYNSGKLQNDFFYLNGKKEGTWRYYSETSILLKTELYENDKLISTTEK
jgi:antitoxin component YwqK of YwqJK toxin-antitoxin module